MEFRQVRDNQLTAEQRLIRNASVEQLYRQTPLGLLTTVANAAILSAVQWDVVPRRGTVIWLGCLLLTTLFRFFTVRAYHARLSATDDTRTWELRIFTGMALNGMVWGAGGILLFPVSSITHQAFLAFVLGGMVAGAAGVYYASFRAFLLFSIPALIPIIFCFLRMGDAIHIAMGGLMLLFAIIISSVTMRVSSSSRSLTKLRYENENLVSYLATAKESADRLNQKLLSEIAEREKAEQMIQQHRDHLEELVRERTAELSFANDQLHKEISARKEAETSLIKSEEYFRTLIENALDIITVLDDRGVILFESNSVTKLLGYAPVELVGKSAFDFVHPDDLQAGQQLFVKILASPQGTMGTIELRFRHKNGEWHTIDVHGKSVGDPAQGLRIIINSRDVTERRKLEREMLRTQKLESLGTLAGGIAHDFNNLITGITTNIEMAKLRSGRDVELQNILTQAEQASFRAKDLTQQLLTFSRGGSPLKQAVSAGPLIRDAVHFALRGSEVACEFSLPKDLPSVEGDEGQLRHVLHNIVINAVQAMPQGGMLTVSAAREPASADDDPAPPSGEYVSISIVDRGVGIPHEHLAKIFDPFFTTKQSASGLGLATAYSIVKKHGGDIAVVSDPGTGTTITVRLPASRVDAATRPESIGLVIGTGRILVMDDEEIIRDAAQRILQAAGYEVETAKDGNDAVAKYQQAREEGRTFDAVILDLTVPGGTGGRETVQRLKDLDPGVKAIVSSGYSSDPIMANYREYGFHGVIAKPYRISEMSDVVKNVVTSS
ncbi:MAG TPA: ATP-binding protein [Nitrospirota bacterium]|nr:ATP-binding protein [Nitrospirota bacterium]